MVLNPMVFKIMGLLQVDPHVNSPMLTSFIDLHLLELPPHASYDGNLHMYNVDLRYRTIGHIKILLVLMVEPLRFQPGCVTICNPTLLTFSVVDLHASNYIDTIWI